MKKLVVLFIICTFAITGCYYAKQTTIPVGECPQATPVEKKVEEAVSPPAAIKVVPVFDPVYFDYDKSNIKDSEKAKLDKLAAYAKEDSAAKFVLEGNCDKNGTEKYNKELGQRRADSAKAYLVSKGVDASRIKTVSFGESKANQKVQTATDRRVDAVNITVTK